MESKKPREVTFRRTQTAHPREESSTDAADSAAHASDGILIGAEDPDDDLPISSEQPDADNPWTAAPSYGEMGPPPPQDGFGIESVGTEHSSSGAPLPPQERDDQTETPLLDAWYATHGHPALAALLRRPEVATAITAATLGATDHAQIAATEGYPWRCICALTITAADGTRWLGTGWLAGPRTIITAGHCVFLHRHGGWARQVEVVPGLNGSQRPYGFAVAASFRSVRGWVNKRQPGYNYGAVVLPPDRAFGNLLGSFGYANLSDYELHGARVNLSGYPSDRTRGTQWHQTQRLDHLAPRALEYAVDTAGGSSGAPVWLVRNGQRYVVGIHGSGTGSGHAATRIGAPVFGNIGAWKREGI